MRRLGMVAVVGLVVGMGCQERERQETRMPPPPAAEGTEREEASAMEELRQQTAELADEVSETTEATERVAREELREGGAAVERAVEGALTGAVAGVVAGTSESRLQLREPDGDRILLRTDARTEVLRDGQPISLDSLSPGAEVRASYEIQGDDWVARRVYVVAPEAR
jgi:hypothetical protein